MMPSREKPRAEEPANAGGERDEATEPTVDERVAQLTAERDEALAARQRALADFRNYQRRADEAERRALGAGAASAVRAIIPALDQFDLALEQDHARMSTEQLADGMRMVRAELAKALDGLGVSRIAPRRGDEFDPMRHEAMLRQPADDLGENRVVATLQPGFSMGEMVLRPAKVAVSGA